MTHFAAASFWQHYRALPPELRRLAAKNYRLLRRDPRHGSLQLKRVGRYWSARVGLDYRALAVPAEGGLLWFWVGPHAAYERIVTS